MKKSVFKKLLCISLTLVLIAAIALMGSACAGKKSENEANAKESQTVSETEMGTGKTALHFEVFDGKKTECYLIHTDKKTVGEALLENSIAEISDGMVNSVFGVALDYTKDKKYWAFYVDGSYASSGVNETDIKESSIYALKAENA